MAKFLDILPTIIMLESFFAGGLLFIGGRFGSAIYWMSAGLLNLSVVFLIRRYG